MEIKYSHRLLCDSNFLKWLIKQKDREELLSHLMHIKSSSLDWKKEHNIILDSEAKICNSEDGRINERYLGGAFKKVPDPAYLSIHNSQITKNIIYGINLANDSPYKCYVLTSPEEESNYKSNPHLQNILSVQIVSGEIARKMILSFYSTFVNGRDLIRIKLRG